MKHVADKEDGYLYGDSSLATSQVTLEELERLKISVGFTQDDRQWLQVAGDVRADRGERDRDAMAERDHCRHPASCAAFEIT